MFVEILKKLINFENLTKAEIDEVMTDMLEGKLLDSQVAAFLVALRMKGETVEEIVNSVYMLKSKGEKLNLNSKNAIDIVGTGGDGSNTFNITTASAFVVSSGGVNVAKHGARAASSTSGSADVLEALGANIMLNPKQNEEILEELGICFMFAPKFNPLMKNAIKPRKEIKIRTIFNCLGPLINPANTDMQLIGVYDKKLVLLMAKVMAKLGIKNGMTVFGEGGLDEASVVSKTHWAKIKEGKITEGVFSPEEFGIKRASFEELKGGTLEDNAEIIKNIFKGKIQGAKKDVILLNSALAFLIANKVNTIEEGILLADDIIKSGAAYEKLLKFVRKTNEYIG